jgi:replicative DNA helicase
LIEVKLRRKFKDGKRVLTIYLNCQAELRKIKEELKRLGYLQEGDEILCYQKFSKEEVQREQSRTHCNSLREA